MVTGQQEDQVIGQPTSSSTASARDSPAESLWLKAFERLSADDQAAFPPHRGDTLNHLESILGVTRKSQEICDKEKWRFKLGGKEVNLREPVTKVLEWVEKFKAVGDIGMQHNAASAALPWAGVRFVLQVCFPVGFSVVRLPRDSNHGTRLV